MALEIRVAEPQQWAEIGALIYDSTNAWYLKNRGFSVYNCTKEDAKIYCQIYDDLDAAYGGCCFIAYDTEANRIAGSCFVHPRSTHVSLGIMNVHPDYFGQKVSSLILARIVEFAKERNKPLRLTSSAMNLDSYSLYNRFGIAPFVMYQDMMIPNFTKDVPVPDDVKALLPKVHRATLDDVPAIVALEQELAFIERASDYRYFIENKDGIWQVWVIENEAGQIDGVLCSVQCPASTMVGPGCIRTEPEMLALIYTALSNMTATPVFLVPVKCVNAIQVLYSWGARNTETHVGQCLGECKAPIGISMPTFLPETC